MFLFRAIAAAELGRFVESEITHLPSDALPKFLKDLTKRIYDSLNNPDTNIKLGGLSVVMKLIEIKAGITETETIIVQIANCLDHSIVNCQGSSFFVLQRTAEVLGHLVKAAPMALAKDWVYIHLSLYISTCMHTTS